MQKSFFNLILLLNVRHQCNVTRSLDGNGQCTLMLCTVSCDSSGKDLTSLRDISL